MEFLCILCVIYVESAMLGTLEYTKGNKVVDAHQKLPVFMFTIFM